jgi:hypothetical protein
MGAAASHDGVAERQRSKDLDVLIQQAQSTNQKMWYNALKNIHRGFDEQAWRNSSEHAQLMASMAYARRLQQEQLALKRRLSKFVTLLRLLLLSQCQRRSTVSLARLGLHCRVLDCPQQLLITCTASLARSHMLQGLWSSIPGQQFCRHSRTPR